MNWAHNKVSKCLVVFSALGLLSIGTNAALAQSQHRQVGAPYTATADPLVPRPHSNPCVVALFTDYRFALHSDRVQSFPFTPRASCPGPWQKVVFEIDFSENAGQQYDRSAMVLIGNTTVYFGTTPEPDPNVADSWHIERDVTDYSALLATAQPGVIILDNCTTDCPPRNGVFTVSADLQFYPFDGPSPFPRRPDVVLPFGLGYLSSPADHLTATFTLPKNIQAAYLDVIAQSQATDEQWFACFPDDLSSIDETYECGHTAFRETEITIDGHLAGIAPVSPWIYTGFLPGQWRPIPAVQTLDFVPFRVNLTPFAGLLSDGAPHTLALNVFNQNSFFVVTAALLLYLDAQSAQVTGAVTENTLTYPSPVATEDIQGTSTITGSFRVTAGRSFTIAGYVNTSQGKVATSISQQQNFFSRQTIDFDMVGFTFLDQKTSFDTSLVATTTISAPHGTTVTREMFSFPMTVALSYPLKNLSSATTTTTQEYRVSKLVLRNGVAADYTSITNSVSATNVSPASSSQQYTVVEGVPGGILNPEPWPDLPDPAGAGHPSYNCKIASASGVLTYVSPGCAQHPNDSQMESH